MATLDDVFVRECLSVFSEQVACGSSLEANTLYSVKGKEEALVTDVLACHSHWLVSETGLERVEGCDRSQPYWIEEPLPEGRRQIYKLHVIPWSVDFKGMPLNETCAVPLWFKANEQAFGIESTMPSRDTMFLQTLARAKERVWTKDLLPFLCLSAQMRLKDLVDIVGDYLFGFSAVPRSSVTFSS